MADLGVNFKQLRSAVEWSVREFETPRKKRLDAIKQFVGYHYGDDGSEHRVPTNFLELAVTIYTRQLIARAPTAMISTPVNALKGFAADMELNLNLVPEEIGLEATLRKAVTEAIFSIGVVKVGIALDDTNNLGHDAGQSFVDLVTLDDYFLDMSAKSRRSIQFEGNDYWLPVEVAREIYNTNMEPDDHTIVGPEGEERAEEITTSEGADLYKDKVWLRDIWLQDSHKLVTYGINSHKVFNVVDWDGPEGSPYHTLSFSDVPGNIMPLPPIALWRDLHELGNNLFRKLSNQAMDRKKAAAFAGGNDEDAERLKNAKDGEGITYSGQKPEEINVGGIDSPTLAFYLQTRDLFSYFAGNLDSLGGLSRTSDTVGQDQLLADAAGARINHMRGEMINFTKSIYSSLAWYEWTDPVRERKLQKPIDGTELSIDILWTPETREGDFLDYNIDIDIYSMQDDSPSVKLQKIGMIMQNYILPLMPMIQESGGTVDIQKLLSIVGEYSNLKEIEDIIIFGDGMRQDEEGEIRGNPNPTTMPNNTTRTYERVTGGGATRSGSDDVMSRILMGAGVQNAEAGNMIKGIA